MRKFRIMAFILTVLLLLGTVGCSKEVESSPWERTMRWNPGRSASTFSDEGYYYHDHKGQLCFLDLKNGGAVDFCRMSEALFVWAKKWIAEDR